MTMGVCNTHTHTHTRAHIHMHARTYVRAHARTHLKIYYRIHFYTVKGQVIFGWFSYWIETGILLARPSKSIPYSKQLRIFVSTIHKIKRQECESNPCPIACNSRVITAHQFSGSHQNSRCINYLKLYCFTAKPN